jgi:hypothetical protein
VACFPFCCISVSRVSLFPDRGWRVIRVSCRRFKDAHTGFLSGVLTIQNIVSRGRWMGKSTVNRSFPCTVHFCQTDTDVHYTTARTTPTVNIPQLSMPSRGQNECHRGSYCTAAPCTGRIALLEADTHMPVLLYHVPKSIAKRSWQSSARPRPHIFYSS